MGFKVTGEPALPQARDAPMSLIEAGGNAL
jgi:hypothetical protein